MSNLIILGNLNQYTFANSIVVSNKISKELFNVSFENIFVIHSHESKKRLNELNEWKDHIKNHSIDTNIINNKILDLHADEKSITKFVDHIEFILRGVKNRENTIIDLSNGTTIQKNMLSIVGYILDAKHQYMIDITKLFKLIDSRKFIKASIIRESYTKAPDSTLLDNIAYLNLSQIFRYKKIIATQTNSFKEIGNENSDFEFFRDNLIKSIELKLKGDKKKDNAIYRIAATAIAASVEELMSEMIKKQIGSVEKKTFGQKIQMIYQEVSQKVNQEDNYNKGFDLEFFQKFNEFMLYLRNSTTHKGKILSDIEKFKADLSVSMSFPYIDFYTKVVYPILTEKENKTCQTKIEVVDNKQLGQEQEYYYGLDGDDTGRLLEEIFVNESECEERFRKVSSSITKAIFIISKSVKDKSKNKRAVIFNAGDDLLFKGCFTYQDIESFQKTYQTVTGGFTCSIGVGKSFHEVYLALKLAKSQPGKNSIIAIDIINRNN